MKKYLRKIFILTLIIIILLGLKKYATPYYLGDVLFGIKLNEFQEKQQMTKFNTVFFGASVTYNHINTALFDSLLQDKNVKSYNFGTSMAINPESFFLYKNFINKQKDNEIKYAFIGLTPLRTIEDKNLNTTKYTYSIDSHTLNHTLQYIKASNYDSSKKIELTKKYIESFLFSYLDFKIFENYSKIENKVESKSTEVNGFLALDTDKKKFRGHKKFLSDTSILSSRIKAAKYFNKLPSDYNLNYYYLNYLKSLINESKSRNIKLIFILHPRLEPRYYEEMVPIANALPKENIINLSNPIKYKEFYNVKYSFDANHMNSKGADIYTNYLVNEFRENTFEPR